MKYFLFLCILALPLLTSCGERKTWKEGGHWVQDANGNMNLEGQETHVESWGDYISERIGAAFIIVFGVVAIIVFVAFSDLKGGIVITRHKD